MLRPTLGGRGEDRVGKIAEDLQAEQWTPMMVEQHESGGAPRVFISYAHETTEHKNWVKTLAADLRKGGIDALLDAWKVLIGGDFTLFMDEIRTCDRVLLVCTPAYARKSNEGEGGVGYERSVITAELAMKIVTTKFVCVLRSGESEDAIPTFAASRRYIDFRQDSEYDVCLEELLRDLHKSPVEPEPPIGPNPFMESKQFSGEVASAKVERSSLESSTDPEEMFTKAEVLLLQGNMLGWKRLVRSTRHDVQPRLNRWRQEIENKNETEDEWRDSSVKGVEVCEPLLVLALSAVDSEIDSIRNQYALIDDFVSIEDWRPSGRTVVVSMPYALAYVYHHVLGAFLVESNKHRDAIRLLSTPGRIPNRTETCKLWQNHGLMGCIDSLGGSGLESWNFLCGFYDSKPWTHHFFPTRKSFLESLRAYTMLASMTELCSWLGDGGAPDDLQKTMLLAVPPMFAIRGEYGSYLPEIVSKAIPDRSTLVSLADSGGTDVERVYQAWPGWFRQWVTRIQQTDWHLGHRPGLKPPPLPGT